jgi:YgiT-type zinc finger domain-containing protein
MNRDAHDRCGCVGKMREGKHDFMARVGDEIIVINDVPALICDTVAKIEYLLEVSREIDVIIKDFFAGRLLAKPLAAGEIIFKTRHESTN